MSPIEEILIIEELKKNKLLSLGWVILNTLCIVINIVFGIWWIVSLLNVLAIIVTIKVFFMTSKVLKEMEVDDTRKDI